MIIFGSGGDVVPLGQTETRYCPVCERERTFSLVLHYRFSHVYYLFGMVEKRQYFEVCDVCNRGEKLDRKEIERQLGRVPIPFMRRFGCLVAILLLVLFGVISALTSH